MYSAENVARLSAAEVRWISRVPETSTEAKQAILVQEADEADGRTGKQEGALSWTPVASAPAGERWVVARTAQGVERARATLARKAEQARLQWEKALWHLGAQRFACEPDAQAALASSLKSVLSGSRSQAQVVAHPTHRPPRTPAQGRRPRWRMSGRSRRV